MHGLAKATFKNARSKEDRHFLNGKIKRLWAQAQNRLFEYDASRQMLERQLKIHIYVLRDKSPEKIYFKERGKNVRESIDRRNNR